MEERIRKVVVAEYDIVKDYGNQVRQYQAAYDKYSMTADVDTRRSALQGISKLKYNIQVANQAFITKMGVACDIGGGGIYNCSRYSPNYGAVSNSYGRLVDYLYELDDAWAANMRLADPAENPSSWQGKIEMGSDGQPKRLQEYEGYLKKVKP